LQIQNIHNQKKLTQYAPENGCKLTRITKQKLLGGEVISPGGRTAGSPLCKPR